MLVMNVISFDEYMLQRSQEAKVLDTSEHEQCAVVQ